MEKKNIWIISVVILLAALIVAGGMSQIARQQRTVTVRGLAERDVPADMAIWPLTFSVGSNDLSQLQTDIMSKIEIVKAYLQEKGLSEADYTIKSADITDNSVNPWLTEKGRYTYLAKQVILVRSSNVEAVMAAQASSLDLAGKGIAVSQDYDSMISFEFTKLNDIKPEMIAEATQNAREVAEQFARDSHSKVGKISQATQGYFTIENAAQGLEQVKHVRVVTSIVYLLK
ncbi:MAG: SIMPL domain-containing protein [Bacteroidales bacterium]|nr:SIMPL domain-containing protein [Bacteroidales bacterium]MCR5555541.1 SIMPL domain-containing protein [Bacteroidales bacterium]